MVDNEVINEIPEEQHLTLGKGVVVVIGVFALFIAECFVVDYLGGYHMGAVFDLSMGFAAGLVGSVGTIVLILAGNASYNNDLKAAAEAEQK